MALNNLPTGTVTFLFTDIEGSTQLWEQRPEAMQAALARHDALLRQAIESHHGAVFKTIGDEFCAAFSGAPEALDAALAAQRALQAESWGETPIKVRIALHAGAAEARDGDYFGLSLNRVARLLSAAHGGQTLLSAAAEEATRGHLPQGAELRDMGEWQLKDLIRPEHIYQLSAPDLPSGFPPLKSLEAFRTNLPAQLTSFVGREKEIDAIKQLIATSRLTTLTGPGGGGKTRLALQVAAGLLDSFPDGVWFVELASLADPALLMQTVITTLGLREEKGRILLDTVTNYLRAKTVLLMLDNCEHLVGASAQFAEALLQACPGVRILASSRESLGVPGEIIHRVPSLSIPDAHLAQSVETVMQSEAGRLFIERAQTALPAFTVTNENVQAVAQVCSRLDGIPLAIELAAARVNMLKVEQIAERLGDRFRLLTGGSRTALPRQQTLRALIDWSYDLLSERERALLRRLSVFSDGWTLEAAEAVCADKDENEKRRPDGSSRVHRVEGVKDEGSSKDGVLHPLAPDGGASFNLHPLDVLEPLTQLVNKSLVVVDVDIAPAASPQGAGYESAETRYRLLETVRQYAREKLSDAGEGLEVRNNHLKYFLALAERAEPELTGPRVVEWLRRLELELDNIRAALEWSLDNDARLGLRLVNALMRFWTEAGYSHSGRNWLAQLLKQPEVLSQTVLRARALGIQGYLLLFGDSDQSAGPILEESLALCQKLGDGQGTAFSLLHLGIVIFKSGDVGEGRQLVTESLALYRELGDKLGIIMALHHLASNVDNNDSERARAYLDEALTLCRETKYPVGMAYCLSDLGLLALRQGDYRTAHRWLEETLTIHRRLGRGESIVYSLIQLGELASREGDYAQASAYYEESLSLAKQTGVNLPLADWVPVKLGYSALWQGDTGRAGRLFEESRQRFTEIDSTIGVIYTLEGFASLAVRRGRPAQSVRLYGWADAARETIDSRRPPVEQADVDRDLAAIHAQLDEAAFAAARAAGRAMSMEQAIAYALEAGSD
ncbi:MAG: tetratricopeptide repeat protein [Anaerolineales bacterium]